MKVWAKIRRPVTVFFVTPLGFATTSHRSRFLFGPHVLAFEPSTSDQEAGRSSGWKFTIIIVRKNRRTSVFNACGLTTQLQAGWIQEQQRMRSVFKIKDSSTIPIEDSVKTDETITRRQKERNESYERGGRRREEGGWESRRGTFSSLLWTFSFMSDISHLIIKLQMSDSRWNWNIPILTGHWPDSLM